MMKLSVKYWHSRRHCDAPTAVRTANSRWRAAMRAIIRPPMFTQHSRSTTPTRPCIRYNGFEYVRLTYVGIPLRAEPAMRYAFSTKGTCCYLGGIKRVNKSFWSEASSSLACYSLVPGLYRQITEPSNVDSGSSD